MALEQPRCSPIGRSTQHTFVVITHAHPFTVEGAGSDGPLHFSLYAALSNIPFLVVSTPLPRMGDVPPGAQNQTYLNTIRIWDFDPLAANPLQLGVAASGLVAAQFRNLSEDAWKPDELIVFGLDERRGIATLLAVSSRPHWWAGQEPSDAAKAGFGFGAGDSLMLPILH